jgi:hypothetical protein
MHKIYQKFSGKTYTLDEFSYFGISKSDAEKRKAIGKKRETLDDVVTKLLDYFEDLQHEDLINTQSNKNQCKEQKDKRLTYSSLSSFLDIAE